MQVTEAERPVWLDGHCSFCHEPATRRKGEPGEDTAWWHLAESCNWRWHLLRDPSPVFVEGPPTCGEVHTTADPSGFGARYTQCRACRRALGPLEEWTVAAWGRAHRGLCQDCGRTLAEWVAGR